MKESETPETPTDESPEQEPFLRRWKRRKDQAAVDAERRADEPEESESAPRPDPERTEAAAAESETPPQEKLKSDEDMPSLETIDEGGSVADFFSPGVSEGLRRAALRRLFSQTALPVGDDLDDYAGDYTKYTKLGDLVTNEMRHRLEVVRQRLERRAQEELAAADTGTETETEIHPEPDTGSRQAAVAIAEQDGVDRTEPDSDGTDEQEHTENDRNTG